MKKHQTKSKKWFTLVELIIVITILAILATIAFISFKSYSWSARDSNRIATVKNIQSGLELLSVKTGNYPDPENMVEIMGSGISLKQWVFWENLQQAIKISGNVKDPLDSAKYIYSTNLNNTKYQLWTYLEENNLIWYFPQTHASNIDYSKRYFYTLWHKIWILLEEDNTPILKEKYSTWLNLEGNSNNFKVYFSNDNNSGSYVWNGDELTQKIVEVQTQTTSSGGNSWDTEPPEPVYDCNNVTTESAFTFTSGEITWYDANIWWLDVVIPCTINGETVTSIRGFAFGFKWITSVKIPNTVTSIWNQAFLQNQLTYVSIPNSITTIWLQVFATNQLTWVTIPNSVRSIWLDAFAGNKLSSIVLSNSITSIWQGAFRNNKLTSIVIPHSVTSIWPQAFEQNLLTSISISNSISAIPNYAFNNNKLTNIVIPNNVTNIWQNAFSSNELTHVTLPNNLISIWISAFNQNMLTSITIPNTVTTLWDILWVNNSGFRFNWPWKDSWNITDWTSWNWWTWNISWTTWIKQS